jgi:feruloyl esterase
MKLPYLSCIVAGLLMASTIGGKQAWAAGPATCESLANYHAENLTITTATAMDAPVTMGQIKVSTSFCRVVGFLTPTSDSHIGFEVWLPPAAAWNHLYEAVGNGGFSGNVNPRAMIPGLSRGYATMTTDEGHINKPEEPVEDVSWALGHPEKFIDYAYRAEHDTTIAAKQLIEAYYGSAPTHSFYSGCSAGGIQGMVEMLRYPKDYDGYIVGDATPNHMDQELGAFWNTLAASIGNESEAIKPTQITLIHKEVLKQCGGKDGGLDTDGFLSNPQACIFDPKPLACSAGQDASSCLSPAQMAELAKIFQGPIDPQTHKPILAGLTPGAEGTWDRYFSGKKNPVGTERPWAGFIAYAAYGDPDYLTKEKYLTFNFGSDLQAIGKEKMGNSTLDAVFNTPSHDLDPVNAEHGKVIQYHGWDDPNIPPMEAVNFFNGVVADQAKRHHLTQQQALAETEQFYRLFMVPGMGHCAGGAGPNSFGQNPGMTKGNPETDILSALETWVEDGAAPEKFIGSRNDPKTRTVDMTRPVCAYPKTPVWNGSGDAKDASSFTCTDKLPSQTAQK